MLFLMLKKSQIQKQLFKIDKKFSFQLVLQLAMLLFSSRKTFFDPDQEHKT